MIQGEVRRIGRSTFVVLSQDDHNQRSGSDPVVAPMVRQRGGGPLVVQTNEADPVTGGIVIPWLETAPADLDSELLGMLTGDTMARAQEALRALFGLSI